MPRMRANAAKLLLGYGGVCSGAVRQTWWPWSVMDAWLWSSSHSRHERSSSNSCQDRAELQSEVGWRERAGSGRGSEVREVRSIEEH